MFEALTALVRARGDCSPRAGAIPILTLALMSVVAVVDPVTFELLATLFVPGLGFVLFSYTFRTYQVTQNSYLMILACGYLWVGVLGIWHVVLDLQQDPALSPAANHVKHLQFSTRVIEALALLLAPFGARVRMTMGGTREGYLIATGLVALAVVGLTNLSWFKVFWIEDSGFTDWHTRGEFGIILALALALVVLLRSKTIVATEREPIAVAIGLTLFAQICFVTSSL